MIPREKTKGTFHVSGKRSASSSDIFRTTKSLNTNQGLFEPFWFSTSGTKMMWGNVFLENDIKTTFDYSNQMRPLGLLYDLYDHSLRSRHFKTLWSGKTLTLSSYTAESGSSRPLTWPFRLIFGFKNVLFRESVQNLTFSWWNIDVFIDSTEGKSFVGIERWDSNIEACLQVGQVALYVCWRSSEFRTILRKSVFWRASPGKGCMAVSVVILVVKAWIQTFRG